MRRHEKIDPERGHQHAKRGEGHLLDDELIEQFVELFFHGEFFAYDKNPVFG